MSNLVVNIAIAAPVRPSANSGNDVTANRWADLLACSGHTVEVLPVAEDQPLPIGLGQQFDVLVVLHARRSASAAKWWRAHHPNKPLVVGLTGTDLYQDLPDDLTTVETVESANALIVLQPKAKIRLAQIDKNWAKKTHTIYQSIIHALPARRPNDDEFRVIVLAHLRSVKAPLLAATAVHDLPAESRIMVHHAGRAHNAEWARRATTEAKVNGRYTWHGELASDTALELLASADILACTSHSEGGANVVTEAIAMGVPVVGTRIDGNMGLLGDDYPGLFPVDDAKSLGQLLRQVETETDLRDELSERMIKLQPITVPSMEQTKLNALIESLVNS